jgi:S-methylmethionine-dependent homocysteine/selenocysteine methylase
LAARHRSGFALETPTWRTSQEWGSQLGYSPDEVAEANRKAVALMERIREAHNVVGPVLISGVRGNASKCSHVELDESEALDDGNPAELGEDYKRLTAYLTRLRVYGGCCGTDHRHAGAIPSACLV